MSDTITVTYGAQKFSPVQYQLFDVGPFSMTTTVKPDETPEQAYARAYAFLAGCAKAAFATAKVEFLQRVRDAGESTRKR